MTNDLIDRYLEGTVSRDALTDRQSAEADAAEHVITATRAFLTARPAPDVTASVMHRIEKLGPTTDKARPRLFERVIRGLWTPREVSIRPAYALLTVGVWLLLLVLVPASWWIPAPAPPLADRLAAPRFFVQFRLEADASRVQLAGSFTNWEPRYELHQTMPGLWTVTVPLGLGVHDYAFVVDGHQWTPDPTAPRIGDGFGGTNSRLTLVSLEMPQL